MALLPVTSCFRRYDDAVAVDMLLFFFDPVLLPVYLVLLPVNMVLLHTQLLRFFRAAKESYCYTFFPGALYSTFFAFLFPTFLWGVVSFLVLLCFLGGRFSCPVRSICFSCH